MMLDLVQAGERSGRAEIFTRIVEFNKQAHQRCVDFLSARSRAEAAEKSLPIRLRRAPRPWCRSSTLAANVLGGHKAAGICKNLRLAGAREAPCESHSLKRKLVPAPRRRSRRDRRCNPDDL